MKEQYKIDLLQINPHVRLVQKNSGNSENYYVPWRVVYDFEIMFIVEGLFNVKSASESFSLSAGDLIIIPPFVRHKQEIPKQSNCTYFAVHFDFYYENESKDFSCDDIYIKPCEMHYENGVEIDELNERKIYEPEGLSHLLKLSISEFSKVHDIFNKMLESYSENSDVSKLELKSHVIMLISTIYREIKKIDSESTYAEQSVNFFVDHLSRNFSAKVDLVKLSQQYGFSPNYFRKIFKQYTNTAPTEYLINLRLEEAKKLLKLNRYTVQVISEMVGYDDVHYFTRLFKKKEGMPPAKYMKDYK